MPIVAREDLYMHVRYGSFICLILDHALYAEFAIRCAFCNVVLHIRVMTRHYIDAHPELAGLAKQQYSFVHDLFHCHFPASNYLRPCHAAGILSHHATAETPLVRDHWPRYCCTGSRLPR